MSTDKEKLEATKRALDMQNQFIDEAFEMLGKVFDFPGLPHEQNFDLLKSKLTLLLRYKRELENLTPGGSEFVNDPEYCARYVKNRIDSLWENTKRLMRERDKAPVPDQQANKT